MEKVPMLDLDHPLGQSALEKGGSSSFQNHWVEQKKYLFLSLSPFPFL